jgi:hypothetical protein
MVGRYMNYELQTLSKEAVMAYFKARHLLVGIKENHKKLI